VNGYEIEYGIAKSTSPSKRRTQLAEVVDLVNVLPFGEEEAKLSATVRAQLEKKGKPIGPYDLLIAGTTFSYQGILVTNNTKEFSRIPKLKLENWFK